MRYLLIFTLIIACYSCKDDPKKEAANPSEEPKVQSLNNPASAHSHLPRLFSNGKTLYFSWVTSQDSLDKLNYASFTEDFQWTATTEITSGADWFTNWADFPAIAENDGVILTNILQKSAAGTYTYDVKLNLLSNDSKPIKQNFILHSDGTKSEHGFVSIIPNDQNSFFVTWLDGRNTAGGHDNHDEHGSGGAMTLRGAFVSLEGEIFDETELDARICDCCQTSAAMTPNGPVVVYRDRSDKEVRDISIVRWSENTSWSSPQTVYADNWEIAGCPVNGPSIDAIGNNLAVAWFTVTKGMPQVKVIFSTDGGETFGSPIRMDKNNAIGRVDVIMLSETEAAISWMENIDDQAYIQLQKVNSNGEVGKLITLAKTSAARASGFPQIELLKGKIYAAWTYTDSENSRREIRSATIPVDLL